MIERKKALELVAGAAHFETEMKRDLKAAWGEDADSEVEVVEAGSSVADLEVFDVTIVPGDLHATGVLTDAPNEHSLLIVLGNLTVERAIVSGQIYVQGDLHIEHVLACDSRGDYGLYVGGKITGRQLVESDHVIEVGGDIAVEQVFRRGHDGAVLDPACLDEDGTPDFAAIADRVREAEDVFRNP